MADELPSRFTEFLQPGLDRLGFLLERLSEQDLSPTTAEVAGSRHVVVSPGRSIAVARPKTVLIAHYDRHDGGPGANDNSAAVFQLIEAATRLRRAGTGGWLIVFTDREETAAVKGVHGQGAYALAEGFKAIGLGEAEFFIFDACGRGDTVIVSTTVDALAEGAERTRRNARELRMRALETGRTATRGRILLLPTPFSDDAGFLAAGIAAQTITLLPEREASVLSRALRGKPEHAASLINKAALDRLGAKKAATFVPETWRALHGAADHASSLTAASFALMPRYMEALASMR